MNTNYERVYEKTIFSASGDYSTPDHISYYRTSKQYVFDNKKFFLQLPAMFKYNKEFIFVGPRFAMVRGDSEISRLIDNPELGYESIRIMLIEKNDKVAKDVDLDDFIKNAELLEDLTYHDRVEILKGFQETHITNHVRASARIDIINKVADYNGIRRQDVPQYEHQIKKDLYLTQWNDSEGKIVKISTRSDNINFFNWDEVSTEDLVECSHGSWTYDPKAELPYELRKIEKVFNEMMDDIEASNDFYMIQPECHEDVMKIIGENQYYRDKYSSLLSHPNRLKLVFAKVIHTKWQESLGLLAE